MKTKILMGLLLATLLTACGGTSGGEEGGGLLGFTILLSANCDGNANEVDVFFDDREIATLIPGNSTEIQTTSGEHRLEAVVDDGRRLGPFTVVVEFDGQTHTLSCSN